MSAKPPSKIFEFAVIFLIVYVITQVSLRFFFPEQYGNAPEKTGILIEAVDSTVKDGHHPQMKISNHTGQELTLPDRCPMPPLAVSRIEGSQKVPLTAEETTLPCEPITSIADGETVTVDLAPWKYSLFGSIGEYELSLPLDGTNIAAALDQPAENITIETRLSIHEAGVLTQLFRTFITKPMLNGLIFIASLLPDYNLGWAIIILTIIIKLILFIPTQHALEGQKKLQAVQPQLDALRDKYKSDPQKMQQETMRIWKENNVNPMQSCLPMLVQFPILIGLFYVIRDGSILDLSRHLIYETYQHIDWTFGTDFLGLNLLEPSIYIMPPLLMVMQFLQMKLTFALNDKKKEQAEKGGKKKKQSSEQQTAQQMQQKMMLYGLPIMIGVFAFQFPAAVSLYWAVSTIFGIGQQLVVNRRVL